MTEKICTFAANSGIAFKTRNAFDDREKARRTCEYCVSREK